MVEIKGFSCFLLLARGLPQLDIEASGQLSFLRSPEAIIAVRSLYLKLPYV